jgi:hypothetical protein
MLQPCARARAHSYTGAPSRFSGIGEGLAFEGSRRLLTSVGPRRRIAVAASSPAVGPKPLPLGGATSFGATGAARL